MTIGWGYLIQGSNRLKEVDELGSELSIAIHCPVHSPAFNKGLYECMCGVIFPLYILKYNDWDMIRRKHEEERKYSLT